MHFHSALLIQHPRPLVNPKWGSVGGEALQLFLLAGRSLDVPFCYGQQQMVVLGLGGCIIHVCPLDFDHCGICLKTGNYPAAHSLRTLLYKKVLKVRAWVCSAIHTIWFQWVWPEHESRSPALLPGSESPYLEVFLSKEKFWPCFGFLNHGYGNFLILVRVMFIIRLSQVTCSSRESSCPWKTGERLN